MKNQRSSRNSPPSILLQELVRACSYGVFLASRVDGRLRWVNAAFARIWGDIPKRLHGRSLAELLAETWQRVVAGVEGEVVGRECVRTREGERLVEAEVLPLEGDEAWLGGLVREVAAECRPILASVRADRMETLGTIAAGMLHEISNPLTYTLLELDLLQQELKVSSSETDHPGQVDLRGDLGGRLARIRAGLEHIQGVVSAVKGIGSVDPRVEALLDPRDAIEKALRFARFKFRDRAELILDLRATAPVRASEGQLVQVILNLLVNAAAAIEPGRIEEHRVWVRLREREGMVEIEVEDTGEGMAPALLERIFEPFFTTKAPDQGTGLGLAISREIVRSMGGDLTVSSVAGEGSRFVVRLPVPDPELAVETVPRHAKTMAGGRRLPRTRDFDAATSDGGRPARVLVVEDDPGIRAALVQILGGRHEVVAVATAEEADGWVEGGTRFDVVLCDLMLPGISGIELHRRWQVRSPEMARRMVFLSGGDAQELAALMATGCPVLEKPLSADTVRRGVEEFLNGVL